MFPRPIKLFDSGVLVLRKKILIPVIVLVSLAGLVLFGRFGFKIGNWQYDSFDEFRKNAHIKLAVDIPEGATDKKFFYRNNLIGRYSIYAFTLDQEAYGTFIDSLVEEYKLEGDPADESNNRYGYPRWYLMKVRDAKDPDYTLDDFPVDFHFEKVINDDIRDYDIIIYSPVGTGTSGFGIVANPDTGRIVVYSEGHIR